MGDVIIITIAGISLGVLNYILYTRYQEDLQVVKNKQNECDLQIISLKDTINAAHGGCIHCIRVLELKFTEFTNRLSREFPELSKEFIKRCKTAKRINSEPSAEPGDNVINLPGMSIVNGVITPTKKKPGPKPKAKKKLI